MSHCRLRSRCLAFKVSVSGLEQAAFMFSSEFVRYAQDGNVIETSLWESALGVSAENVCLRVKCYTRSLSRLILDLVI